MPEKIRKDLVDINGHVTHRMINDVTDIDPAVRAQAAARAQQVPSAAAGQDPASFAGISADITALPAPNHYQHAFDVVLEHDGSDRSLQTTYAHLSEREPTAQAVLAHLAFEARAFSHHRDAAALADTFDLDTTPTVDGRSEADRVRADFQRTHDRLQELLGEDYEPITRQALEHEPFASSVS